MARRDAERGISLLETLVALALLGVVVVGIGSVLENAERGRLALAAKNDAETQANVFFDRLQRYFRTRMTTRADNGFTIAPCGGASSATCLDIVRRQQRGSTESTERFRIRSACKALTPRESGVVARLGIDKKRLAESVDELCGFKCPEGRRPIIAVSHYLDPEQFPGKKRDYALPAGKRFGEGFAATAGFCVNRAGAEEVRVLQGFSYLRAGNGVVFKLVRKDASWPLREDASQIEWVP